MFRSLLEGLYQHGLEGVIELRTISPSREIKQHWNTTIDQAVRTAYSLDQAGGANVYYGVNPRPRAMHAGGHGEMNEAIQHILTVVADIDDIGTLSPEAVFSSYGLYPSAVVATGRGAHAYWFLDKPAENTKGFASVRQEFQELGPSDSVHDAARVMRVPGTLNYKFNPPRKGSLIRVTATIRYGTGIFEKVPRLSDKARSALATNDSRGYPSRSERDWMIVREMVECEFTDEEVFQVFEHSPAGERYRVNWPVKLDHDIKKARETQTVKDSTTGVDILERNNCYWRRSEEGGPPSQISTFVIKPVALMKGDTNEEDRILGDLSAEGTDHVWEDHQIPKGAFVDGRSLNKHLGIAACMWLGSDQEARHLLPYLMRKIQANNVPMVRIIKSLGRHGTVWITKDGVITATTVRPFAEAGYMYLERKQEMPNLDISFPSDPSALVRKTFGHLKDVNRAQVVWPVVGWFFACFYKPLLADGRAFPILQVIGSRGAGKTSFIRNIMLRIIGYNPPAGYTCDTTDFVQLTLQGFSTSTPVFFAEYRQSLPTAERFLRRLRLTYDAGTDARGRGDQTTTAYQLTSPIVMDGENPADEPAILERSILVNMSPEEIDDDRRQAYKGLSQLPLHELAGPLIRHSLKNEPEVQKATAIVRRAFKNLPDRIEQNLVDVTVGLLFYKQFAELYDAYYRPINENFIEVVLHDSIRSATMGETGRTKTLGDELIQDIVNQVAASGAGLKVGKGICASSNPFVWRYKPEDETLAFQLQSALNWWTYYRRQRGLPTLSSATAKAQLRERRSLPDVRDDLGQYVVDSSTVNYGHVGTYASYVISIEKAHASGLDIPPTLKHVITVSYAPGRN